MSTEATIWAWKQQLPVAQKLVLLSMADRAGETFQCWPSVRRLCFDTNASERTVQQAISELEKRGLIKRDMRQGRATLYYLIGVQGRESTPAESAPPQKLPPANTAGTPAESAPHPRRICTQNLKENLTRTSQGGESAQARPAPAQTASPVQADQTGQADQTDQGSKKPKPQKPASEEKQTYGEFHNVRLTVDEYERLVQDYGEHEAKAAIDFLDLHLGARKGADPYKSHNLAMRKWVFQKLAEDRRKLGIKPSVKPQSAAPSGKDFFARMEEIERRQEHESL